MKQFSLHSDFIELNKLLKYFGIAESGGAANEMIAEGMVRVNGEVETRKRKKLFPNDIISVQDEKIIITVAKN